ncbi:MAG: AAA family ATPase [Candidatus Micrarchaeia archaeon]
MIKSVEMTNWKVHKHSKLDFNKGVNVIVGIMGAGKSSVLDAISFGLFGSFPALNHRRTTLNDIISNKPTVSNEAEVKVRFVIGNDEYLVTRHIVRDGSSSAKLEKNGTEIYTQATKVSEEIENILKIDYDTFSRVVYSEQNRLDYFLELAKGDRKKQIDQMLGLDNFARSEENVVSLVNHIKDIIGDEEDLLSHIEVEKLKSSLESLTKEKVEYLEEKKKLEEQKAKLDSEIKTLSEELELSKKAYEKKQRISKELTEMSEKQRVLKSELSKISVSASKEELEKKLDSLSKMALVLEEELKKIKSEERASTKLLADSESQLIEITSKKKESEKLKLLLKEKSIDMLEKELHEIEVMLSGAMKDLADAKSRKTENEKWVKELEKHLTACPVCNRELTDELRVALLRQKKEIVDNANMAVAVAEKSIADLKAKKDKLEDEVRKTKLAQEKFLEYNGVDEKLAEASSKVELNKKELEIITKKADAKNAEYDKLKKEKNEIESQFESISRKERYESDIKQLGESIESKKIELEAISIDEKVLYAMQDKLSALLSSMSEVKSKISSSDKYLSSIELQIAEKVKSISDANERKERLEKRKKLVSNLNKFRTALVDTESVIRAELVKSINSYLQSVWPELYPYLDYTSLRLNAKKDDYTLEANIGINSSGDPQWLDINNVASGGERSIACLAMRIAFAMVVVPNLKWLILDEPTHNLDENGISKLVEIMGGSLPKVVDQIFVITHDPSLRNISASRIYQIERNKNEDEYANVVEIN